jgi:hypothetical protein
MGRHPGSMKRVAILCLLLTVSAGFSLIAQIDPSAATGRMYVDSTGSNVHAILKGNLKDERGNPIVNAEVECSDGNIICGREVTDFDGNYVIGSLKPGKMTLTFRFQGKELIITDISLSSGQRRSVDGTLTMVMPKSPTIRFYCRIICPPIIDPKYPGGHASRADVMLR